MRASRRALAMGAACVALVASGCGSSGHHPTAEALASPPIDQLSTPRPLGCPIGTVVNDAPTLQTALKSAVPGAVILLAPGTYGGHFVASVSGTAEAPITLCGTKYSVLDGGGIKLGYTFHLDGPSWWRLVGFSVTGGQKGVVADHANHNLISGLFVHDIGDEGIHLRSFSSDNIVEAVTVRHTGMLNTKFGEGIYVGSANSNWGKYSSGGPDKSDRNVIRNNDIAGTTAENIDIKEGTTAGQIAGNKLSGDGMVASAAGAWVNIKGNGWTVTGNSGRQSLKDGFQVHRVYAGWGVGNVFAGNQAEVDGPGFGFYVQNVSLQTVLACTNSATAAASGLSNIACTR